MKENDIRFARLLLIVNGAVPLVLLGWDALHHQLGANPVKFTLLTTGMMGLIFLLLTLLVTPLRKISGWNWIIFSRRTLGLYAFFYTCLHFLIFFGLDRSFNVSSTLTEMVKRKYLIIGSTGLLVMVPLAVTSTNAMIKRLGGKRWRALHRLAYANLDLLPLPIAACEPCSATAAIPPETNQPSSLPNPGTDNYDSTFFCETRLVGGNIPTSWYYTDANTQQVKMIIL